MSKLLLEEFEGLKSQFLNDFVSIVEMEEIPPELIFNWDQTCIKIVPSSLWTMKQQGARRVETVGNSDKRLITAVVCGTLVGEFLPIQVIYNRKTSRSHPHFSFPDDWHITRTSKHRSNESTMMDYINVNSKRHFNIERKQACTCYNGQF